MKAAEEYGSFFLSLWIHRRVFHLSNIFPKIRFELKFNPIKAQLILEIDSLNRKLSNCNRASLCPEGAVFCTPALQGFRKQSEQETLSYSQELLTARLPTPNEAHTRAVSASLPGSNPQFSTFGTSELSATDLWL